MGLKIITILLSIVSMSLVAQETLDSKSTINEKIKELEKNVVKLPINKMFFAQNKKGVFVFSQGGRFVFQGKVYDGWQHKYLDTIEDAQSSLHVPLSQMGIQPEQLGALHSIKEGKTDLLVFTDPNCIACQKLYDKIEKDIGDEYKISYVLTNIIGGAKSTEEIKRLYCNPNKEQALELLLSSQHNEIPLMKGDQCDYSRLFTNLAAVQMLNIDKLPALVKPNGEMISGIPRNIELFIKGEKND